MPHATSNCDLIVFPTNLVINGKIKKRSFVASTSVASQILSSTFNTQGMLLRTDFLREIGGWDSRLQVWQDWELGIRLLLHCPRVTFFPERAYHLLHQYCLDALEPFFLDLLRIFHEVGVWIHTQTLVV